MSKAEKLGSDTKNFVARVKNQERVSQQTNFVNQILEDTLKEETKEKIVSEEKEKLLNVGKINETVTNYRDEIIQQIEKNSNKNNKIKDEIVKEKVTSTKNESFVTKDRKKIFQEIDILENFIENVIEVPSEGFGSRLENIILSPKRKGSFYFFNKGEFLYSNWKKYLEEVRDSVNFEDYKFYFMKPFYKKDIENSKVGYPLSYYDSYSEYNFYIEDYEKAINLLHENFIPNLYVFSFLEREIQDGRKPNPRYNNLITLNDSFKYDVTKPAGEYYDKYIKFSSQIQKDFFYQKIVDTYSNILISPEDVEYFNSLASKREI
jgi:hypothetical protein